MRLIFIDEMRYGLMSNIRRSWSKIGKRTVYLNQQEYADRYLYSAIDPINAETFHMMDFNDASTIETDLFLSALGQRFPNEHLVVIWDNAPFHKPKSLQKEDITLIYLPPYSPQLNPVERFFGEMRKFTANRIFREGIDALSKTVEEAVLTLSKTKEGIKSLTAYDWIIEQWRVVSENRDVRLCG